MANKRHTIARKNLLCSKTHAFETKQEGSKKTSSEGHLTLKHHQVYCVEHDDYTHCFEKHAVSFDFVFTLVFVLSVSASIRQSSTVSLDRRRQIC